MIFLSSLKVGSLLFFLLFFSKRAFAQTCGWSWSVESENSVLSSNNTCSCNAGFLSNCDLLPNSVYLFFLSDTNDNNLQIPLTAVDAATFENCSALQQLSLAYNEISFLPEKLFFNLVALQALSLQFNKLTGLSVLTFSNLSQLTFLSLNANLITQILPATFDNLTKLVWLSLQGNLLQALPAGLFNFNFNSNVGTFNNTLFLNTNPWNCYASSNSNTTCVADVLRNNTNAFNAFNSALNQFGGINVFVDANKGTENEGTFCKFPLPSLISTDTICAPLPPTPPPAPSNVTSLPFSFDIRIQDSRSISDVVGFCTATVPTTTTATTSTTTTTLSTSATATTTSAATPTPAPLGQLCGFMGNDPPSTPYYYQTPPNNGDNPCATTQYTLWYRSLVLHHGHTHGHEPKWFMWPNIDIFGQTNLTCDQGLSCQRAEQIMSNGVVVHPKSTAMCGYEPVIGDTPPRFSYVDGCNGQYNQYTCMCEVYSSSHDGCEGIRNSDLYAYRCQSALSVLNVPPPAPKICLQATFFTSTSKNGKFSLTAADLEIVNNGTGFVNAKNEIITNPVTVIGCDQNNCLYPTLSTDTSWFNFAYQQSNYVPANNIEIITLSKIPNLNFNGVDLKNSMNAKCLRISFSHKIQLVQFMTYQPSNQNEVVVAYLPFIYFGQVLTSETFTISVRHTDFGIPLTVEVAYSLKACSNLTNLTDSFTQRNYITIKPQPAVGYAAAIHHEELCLLSDDPSRDCIFNFSIPELGGFSQSNFNVNLDIVKWPCTKLFSSTYANNIPSHSLVINGKWSMLMYAGECINITRGEAFIYYPDKDIPIFTVLEKNISSLKWNRLNTSFSTIMASNNNPGFKASFQMMQSDSAYLTDPSKKERFFYTDPCYKFWQTQSTLDLFQNPIYQHTRDDYIINNCQYIMYKIISPCKYYWNSTFVKIKDTRDTSGLTCYFFVAHKFYYNSSAFNVFSFTDSQKVHFQPTIHWRQAGLQLPKYATKFDILQPSYYQAIRTKPLLSTDQPLLFKNYFPKNKPYVEANYTTGSEAGLLFVQGQLAAVKFGSVTLIRDPSQEDALFFYPSNVKTKTLLTFYLQNITSDCFIRPWNLWETGTPMSFFPQPSKMS